MDLSSAYSTVRDLPDSALQKEMQQPSGMLPTYLVMGELADRASIRGGMGNPKPPTIKDQIMQRLQASPPGPPSQAPNYQPVPGYSRGGIIAQLNPFIAQMKGMDPVGGSDLTAGLIQDQANGMNGGMMPLSSPSAPTAPETPQYLGNLNPLPPGNPFAVDSGGLATLLRSR